MRSWWKPASRSAGDHSCLGEFHHASLPLDADGKKVGSATAGRSCTLSVFHVPLIAWRICLVGVKMSANSKCDWLLHDSRILTNVSMFRPHSVRRVFHIPLLIVYPICGWASVVSPSCVMTENPSIFSSQSNDLRCICTHPRPLSSCGQGPLRGPSNSVILVLESVTRGG